jgi:hypothetical protein
MGRLIGALLLGFSFFPLIAVATTDALVLTDVRLVGTDRLNSADVARGLHLKLGETTTRQNLVSACHRFQHLKLFRSSQCRYQEHDHTISMTIVLDDKWGGMPVVLDNFVWMIREAVVARLKQEIPLFMSDLPQSSTLNNEIIRVLQELVNERGIKAFVRYDDSFWTDRGMNVFYIDGLSTPVAGLEIRGENAPTDEAFLKFSDFYEKENFSAARLTWIIWWVTRDLYKPRGYLRPVVHEPVVQLSGETEGLYPVRVILPISSGPVYTFNSVKFGGLAEKHSADLLPRWKLKLGDPYNDAYVQTFINEILAEPWAMLTPTQSHLAVTCSELDDATKKVSLIITVEDPKKTYTTPRDCEENIAQRSERTILFPTLR